MGSSERQRINAIEGYEVEMLGNGSAVMQVSDCHCDNLFLELSIQSNVLQSN